MDPNPSGPTSSSTSIPLKPVNATVTARQTLLGATTVTSTSMGDITPQTGQHAPLGQATEDTKGKTVTGQPQQELRKVTPRIYWRHSPDRLTYSFPTKGLCDNTFNDIQELYSSANPRLQPAGGWHTVSGWFFSSFVIKYLITKLGKIPINLYNN